MGGAREWFGVYRGGLWGGWVRGWGEGRVRVTVGPTLAPQRKRVSDPRVRRCEPKRRRDAHRRLPQNLTAPLTSLDPVEVQRRLAAVSNGELRRRARGELPDLLAHARAPLPQRSQGCGSTAVESSAVRSSAVPPANGRSQHAHRRALVDAGGGGAGAGVGACELKLTLQHPVDRRHLARPKHLLEIGHQAHQRLAAQRKEEPVVGEVAVVGVKVGGVREDRALVLTLVRAQRGEH